MDDSVGWVGLGKMGNPMCTQLLSKGYYVTVFNRTEEKTREIKKLGASIASSPKEVAQRSNVIFIMVSDSNALLEVIEGQDGISRGLREDSIVIDMSTISPETSSVADRAIGTESSCFLRAPVVGSVHQANEGELLVLCSGNKAAFNKVVPLFKAFSVDQIYLGNEEEARFMKLVLNIIIGTTIQTVVESLVFGHKAGLDYGTMLEVINKSVVASPLIGYKTESLVNRNFAPLSTVNIMKKDFDIILKEAKKMQVPLALSEITHKFLKKAQDSNKGEKDFTVVIQIMEEVAGVNANKYL